MEPEIWLGSRETMLRHDCYTKSSWLSIERSVISQASSPLSLPLAPNAHARGNLESARAIFEECLRLSEEAGNDRATAQVLNNLARLLEAGGDFAGAKPLCEEALALFGRQRDMPGVAWLESRLGDLERKLGNFDAARSSYD